MMKESIGKILYALLGLVAMPFVLAVSFFSSLIFLGNIDKNAGAAAFFYAWLLSLFFTLLYFIVGLFLFYKFCKKGQQRELQRMRLFFLFIFAALIGSLLLALVFAQAS